MTVLHTHLYLSHLLYAVPLAAIPHLRTVIRSLAGTDRPVASNPVFAQALMKITQSNVGIGIGQRDLVVGVNQFFADRLGYAIPEIVGRRIAEFVSGPYQASVPMFTQRTIPLRHQDGTIVSAEVTVFPMLTETTTHFVIVEFAG